MKAIVMAGGFAKRLWPLTKELAKPLINIGGKPVINYTIEELLRLKSLGIIDEVIVSINAKFADDFNKWLSNFNFDVNIVVEECRHEGEKLGAIGAINFVIQKEHLNDDLLIIGGDNLFDFRTFSFLNAIEFFKDHNEAVVCGYDVLTKERAKLYGVIVPDGHNKVIEFVEKPEDPKATLISSGCYLLSRDTLKILSQYIADGNPKDRPGDFLQWFYKRHNLYVFPFSGTWFDIGDHESLKNADEFAKNELM